MAANPFDQFDQQAVNPFDQFDVSATKPAPPEKTGVLRAAADIPVQVGRGVAVGVKALSDVFGANNPVSRAATGVEDFLGGLLSAQAKNDQTEIARIMKEAQDKGVGDQVTAAVKAFATAPVDMLSQALGTAAPVLAGGVLGAITRLGAMGVTAAGAGVGAAMGAGTVKGQIYDAVKQELIANKVPEAEADQRAQQAQEYGGKNLDQILMGAGLGAVEAAFGAEKILTGLLRKGAVKPSALPAKYRIPTAAATEAVPEMAQAAQEQVAQNIALQREGYDVPTMRGVAGQAALEGLAGAGLGAITGAVQRREVEKPAEEKPTPRALEYKPEALVVFPDGSVGKRADVENYINSLPEDQRIEARARLLGMGERPAAPIKEGAPLTEDEIFQLDQQLMAGAPRPRAEDVLEEVRGKIKTAPPTTPADIARIRDDHETAVINSLLEQDKKMQSVSDLARLNLERMSQTESMEAATQDADRRVREARLMGRVQSLIDQNIPFASTAIADINRKFELIGEAPLDDNERSRVQNIMTMAQGFTDFVKLPSLPVREQDRFAENQAMEALIKERKPRGEVSSKPVRAETTAPSPVIGEAPVSGRVEEGTAIRPAVSPEPGIAEDRQRAEPVAAPTAEPVKRIGASGMGQRMVNAANRFRDSAVEQFGLTPEQADRAMGRLMKEKVLSLDPVTGQYKLKDGRFWDREVLLRAAGEAAPESITEPERAEEAKPVELAAVQPEEKQTELAEAPDTLTDEEFDQYEREQTQEAISRLSSGDYAAPRPATFVRPGMRSKVDEAMDRAAQNAYRKAVREFLQAPLTAKPPTGKSEGIDYSIYDAVDGLTDIEPQRIETKAPVAKSFRNKLEVLFKYVVPSKDIRYYLTRVMLDPEKSRMVATDGKSLVVVEDESVKQNAPERPLGVTRDKAILVDKDGTWATADDGRPMEAIYPDVDKVIPKTDRTDAVSYNTDDFVAYAKGVEKSNKFVKKDLPLVLQIYNKQNAFDVERLVSLGEIFRRLGYKNFVVTLPNDPLDGRLMATSPDGKVKQIVMSRKYGETTGEIKRRFYKPYDPVAIKKSLRAASAQQLSNFEQTLRMALNKLGLKDVGVKLIEGMREEGSYAQQLIRIAADSANPIRTLRHEAIHALRELGFFTPQQWQSLSKMAKDKWIDQYLKQRNIDGKPLKAGKESRYDAYMREYEGNMEKITEEAVADAFADFEATKPPSGLISALLTRLRNLFQAIKSALTKVESPEQIFGKVERGELAAKEVSRPAEEARKSLRKEEPKPTPTTAGQAALNTINQLGMGVKAPEERRIDKVKKKLEQIGEAPVKDTAKEWKQTASDFLAKIDGSIFSADAPFENKLRQGFREDFKDIKDFVGALLKVSQSQAVAADAVSTRGMLIGKVQYVKDLFKWVAVEDEANEINKARILDGIAKKYGLTKEEAVRVAHTYLSAANYEGILERNAALEKKIKELKKEQKQLLSGAEGDLSDKNKQARLNELKAEISRLDAAEVFVTEEQAAMVEPGLSIADQIPEVKEITTLWNKQRENVKNTMVETGLWTPEYADAMMDNAAYVPFYREMEEEADANPEMMIRGLQVKAKEHKLKGSKAAVADVFENMARWQQYAINRAIRNHKALQMIDAAREMNIGDTTMARKVGEAERGKNVVRVWRDGKQEFYEMADPLFMDAFKSLGAVSIPTIKYFTKIANMLRESIVLYPMFSLGQVPQDAVAAIFASGLQPKFAFKIPYLAVKEFIKTMRGTSNIHNELRDFGAVGVRDFNASIAREDAEITAGIKAPRGVMGKTKYVLERIAMSADNAVRQAVYEAAMQQPGITKAEALEKAFEIINFRRRGSSKMVNLIGQTVPFFYAYLSAQRVAYKTITGVGISPTERKAALETLAYTTAATMALSFIYAMANGGDDDYERTPSNVRDRSIVIPGTGGLRIPLRPDFFLFPKIIAEHTYHLMADNGFSDPAKFKKAMRDNFANAAFSPNVVPQIAKPTLEIAINYDFFQGKPIIGYFEKNKEASRQFNETTSELGKYLGRFGLSPQMVDHFARGYFGTVGGLVLWGTNFFIEGEPGVPRPELTASDMVATMPGMGAFKQKSTENALKVDFYELRDAIEKAKNTYDDMKTRSPEGLQTFLEDEKNLAKLAMEKGVTKIADHLSKIRRAIQQTAAAPEDRMSASEKEERIKELREVEMQMLKGINLKSLREQAKL